MRAITVRPGQSRSAQLEELPDPPADPSLLMVQAIALGICGTDMEIVEGHFGAAAPGQSRLVLGHESLGRVLKAPPGSGFSTGERVVGVVRRPDPLPCPNCAAREWDMCRTDEYTERGIKGLDGYGAERYTLEPAFAVKVPDPLGDLGVLLEPTSVLAKGWEQIERIGARAAAWKPERVLVTGAGPIGLLAALMGRQRGLDVHVVDRFTTGPKPALVAALGATYHASTSVKDLHLAPDVVIECTGADQLIHESLLVAAPNAIVCLAGIPAADRELPVKLAALNKQMVLRNNVVFGTVNANLRHFHSAVAALERADHRWLASLITRRVPLASWQDALERRPGDVKTVIEF